MREACYSPLVGIYGTVPCILSARLAQSGPDSIGPVDPDTGARKKREKRNLKKAFTELEKSM